MLVLNPVATWQWCDGSQQLAQGSSPTFELRPCPVALPELFARETVFVLEVPQAASLPPALPNGVSTFPLL